MFSTSIEKVWMSLTFERGFNFRLFSTVPKVVQLDLSSDCKNSTFLGKKTM